MTIRAVGIIAAAVAGMAAGASLAVAQGSRPWVDPPSDLAAPAPKPRVEEPKPTPVAAKPAETEVAKEKPVEVRSEPAKAEAPKPKPEVAETKPAPRAKRKATASASARTITNRPQARSRVAERRGASAERPDGLVVMRMQTLQFPDGRTVTVLTRPGEAPDPWGASR